MSSSDDWWSKPTDADSGDDRQEEREALTDAAADLRYAAEYMRDAMTPAAPSKESNWDFTWLTPSQLRKRKNGRAFLDSLWTVGPAYTLFLASQQFGFLTAVGMTFIGFVIIGGWHLQAERKATRLLTWGLPVGLVYYAPVAIIFGLGTVLVGG